jgi:acetolactate synthase I/II/III large subunit
LQEAIVELVLVDIGAVKMWMARLYPTYKPNTYLISNGLSTIAFALPGDMAAKLACSERKVLAAVGYGGFLMHGSELATAVRDHVPIVVLIWEDGAYGLIKWKMHLELGRHSSVDFQNPDFLKYAESFGAKGYRINHTDELLPILKSSLIDDAVSDHMSC